VESNEDPGSTIGDLTEAPNQSLENLDTPTPNPTQEGNPPDDSALPMPWPYPPPDGWSVEWDPFPANTDLSE
jgi:hypothetical protein